MTRALRTILLFALVLGGCAQSGDLFGTGGTCEPWITVVPRTTAVEAVDLLFVIDTSSDLADARASLAREIPRAIAALTSGDHDRDGVVEHTPVPSVHVGVVTADMGTGAVTVEGCSPGVGGDGRLVREGCGSEASGVFAFEGATDEAQAAVVDCATVLESTDCPFTQPLEAALRALSVSQPTEWTRPGYEPPIFEDGGYGHGDGANAGFLRPSSALAVMVVTNDDDCSALSPLAYGADLPVGLRCTEPPALRPVSRFVDGLLGLRSSAGMLTFAVVAGIPAGLAVSGYDDALALPELQQQVDPELRDHLLPSCSLGALSARPPRRLLETARDLHARGADTSFRSICEGSLAPSVDSLIEHVASQIPPTCVIAEPDAQGHLACELVVAIPLWDEVASRCSELPPSIAYDDLGVAEGYYGPSSICRLRQGEDGSEQGWTLDSSAPECAHTIRVNGTDPRLYGDLVWRCYTPAPLSPTDERACDPATDALVDGSTTCAALGLACDPFALRCGRRCESNDDCSSGICDRHSAAQVFSTFVPPRLSPSDVRGFCVSYDSCP